VRYPSRGPRVVATSLWRPFFCLLRQGDTESLDIFSTRRRLARWRTATSIPPTRLRCSRRPGHPTTHHAVVDELRKRFFTEWPYLLGVLFAHREACMLAALRALARALARPKLTRAGLRREMLAALAAIAERGPEAVPPRSGPE